MRTKAARIAEVVDRLQEVADVTGAPAVWWHLGRLEVIGSLSALFSMEQVNEALAEALDALEQVEAEWFVATEPAKLDPMQEVWVQSRFEIQGQERWLDFERMRRHEAEAFVAGRPDRRIHP